MRFDWFGRANSRHYPAPMSAIDSRRVLWTNVQALMHHHWGKENLTRLAAEAEVGLGTCTRIKQQQTSVGVEVVDRIAQVFHLDSWQLLVPGLNPKSPPVLILSEAERDFYRRVINATREFKDTGH